MIVVPPVNLPAARMLPLYVTFEIVTPVPTSSFTRSAGVTPLFRSVTTSPPPSIICGATFNLPGGRALGIRLELRASEERAALCRVVKVCAVTRPAGPKRSGTARRRESLVLSRGKPTARKDGIFIFTILLRELRGEVLDLV